MSGLATIVAVPLAAFSMASLRSSHGEGFVGLSIFWLLSLALLTTRMPIFQAFRLLNDTADKSISVKGMTAVASQGKGL